MAWPRMSGWSPRSRPNSPPPKRRASSPKNRRAGITSSIPRPLPLSDKGHLLPDFYSGATGLPGRFSSEGFLLRRSQTRQAGRIADQAASGAKVARPIDRRDGIAGRQRHELLAPADQKRFAADNQRAGLQWGKSREGRVDLVFGAGIQNVNLHLLGASRFLGRPYHTLGIYVVRVADQG